jgi:CHAD domain-containing protein
VARLQTLQVAHSPPHAADSILATAHTALEGLSAGKPTEAIHDLRVALKRWRALLRIMKDRLGGEAVVLRREARLLSREFSHCRDAQAALDALTDIVTSKVIEMPSISERTQATITDRLEGIRKASESIVRDAEAARRRRDGLARASACASAWPPDHMTFDEIATALTQSYRRARRRLPRSWEAIDSEGVHELRKALVTFRYQLEFIEPLWPRMWRSFTGEVQKVRQQLGKSNDLAVLERMTRPKQPLAHWRSRLMPLIEGQRHFHLDRARMLASRVFSEAPRSFQKRTEAMWKAAAAAEPE